jgi:hypothetical protein
VVIAAAAVASANAAPTLPPRTAEQLLTEVAQATKTPLGPVAATVQETSDLGLPALPAFAQQTGGPAGLSAGPESISIWYRDPQHLRVAQPVQAGETDLRLDGRTLWVWNSKTQTATRYVLPAHFSGVPAPNGNGLVPPGRAHASSGGTGSSIPDTPQAAAAQVLKAVGPTTVVSVQRNVYVAGRAAYQLSLVPRSSKSLVGSVLIAIDASRRIPLRVEVYARASSTLAYSIGFTRLTFGTPAASNFSFTPPPGATVRHVTVPSNLKAALKQAGLGAGALGGLGVGPAAAAALGTPVMPAGSASSSAPLVRAGKAVVKPGSLPRIPEKALAAIKAQFAKSLPKSMSAAQRAKAIRAFTAALQANAQTTKNLGNNGGGFVNFQTAPMAAAPGGAPRVIGTGWLSVAATPPSPQVASAVKQALSGNPGGIQRGSATYGTSSSSAYSSTLTVSSAVGPGSAVLQALLTAATPVHGSWGSGRLLRTTLLTVLVTSKGQILAGAVTPGVLYADVARDAG